MPNLTNYCLGFLFDENLQNILLIQKNKPDWQKGLWNGIGGKVEENETFHQAMIRETKEEIGLDVDDWLLMARVTGRDWDMLVYATQYDGLHEAKQMEDEMIKIFPVKSIDTLNFIPNISWLVPYCKWRLECHTTEAYHLF